LRALPNLPIFVVSRDASLFGASFSFWIDIWILLKTFKQKEVQQ